MSVNTVPKPNAGYWGDVVGSFDVATNSYNPPNGLADFVDIQAMVARFSNLPSAPPRLWCDLASSVTVFPSSLRRFVASSLAVSQPRDRLCRYRRGGGRVPKQAVSVRSAGYMPVAGKARSVKESVPGVTTRGRRCENPNLSSRWCENPFSHPPMRESLPARQLQICAIGAICGCSPPRSFFFRIPHSPFPIRYSTFDTRHSAPFQELP